MKTNPNNGRALGLAVMLAPTLVLAQGAISFPGGSLPLLPTLGLSFTNVGIAAPSGNPGLLFPPLTSPPEGEYLVLRPWHGSNGGTVQPVVIHIPSSRPLPEAPEFSPENDVEIFGVSQQTVFTPVPEPSSLGLLAASAAAFVFKRRFRPSTR